MCASPGRVRGSAVLEYNERYPAHHKNNMSAELSFDRTTGMLTLGEFEHALLDNLAGPNVPHVLSLEHLGRLLEVARRSAAAFETVPLKGMAAMFLDELQQTLKCLS